MNNNMGNEMSKRRGENESIGCNVNECLYHAQGENYCTLPHIDVVKHEKVADTIECTDCGSFKKS
ncbi:MAG: DUF1540 domain-containing protein [Bacillota bacterium]|nr:DUF1540 domain-containing protein [Bacillota bacterium]